ncbi:MAG: SixA phosphatase family protein [Anaerolineales bacterium]
MKIPKTYLVRHAEAMWAERDPDRPLTAIGRQYAEQMANMATQLGIEVQQIRHSGKARAEQTAEILGDALSPVEGVGAVAGVEPMDDVQPVAEALDKICHIDAGRPPAVHGASGGATADR